MGNRFENGTGWPIQTEIIETEQAKTEQKKKKGFWKWILGALAAIGAAIAAIFASRGNTPQIDGEGAPLPTDNDCIPERSQTIVWADNGFPVKVRQKPSAQCGMYDKLPVGTPVEVVSIGDEWTKVNVGTRKGWYIMTQFLKYGTDVTGTIEPEQGYTTQNEDPTEPMVTVEISDLTEEQARSLEARYPRAVRVTESEVTAG